MLNKQCVKRSVSDKTKKGLSHNQNVHIIVKLRIQCVFFHDNMRQYIGAGVSAPRGVLTLIYQAVTV